MHHLKFIVVVSYFYVTELEAFTNYDLENIITPVDVDHFEELLIESEYNAEETSFLVNGFRHGFDIEYSGPVKRQSRSENIPFTVGNAKDMWGKIMKEVKSGRYAGPYEEIPYENFIQSPIGLVSKAGNKTRLIFHLSFDFDKRDMNNQQPSVNACTPKDRCSMKYNDLDVAMRLCLRVSEEAKRLFGSGIIFLGKTDLSSAFRVLPLRKDCFRWQILKAVDLRDGKTKYFVKKCLPFGSSISCSHYQRFSNTLRHIIEFRTGFHGRAINNYLDNFLFIAFTEMVCNQMIQMFIKLCQELRVPVAFEKTEWAGTLVVFLGILLDWVNLVLSLPVEKKNKALNLLNNILSKKRATVKQIQVLTGYLNFLTKAIFAGRTFTPRMYAKISQQGRTVWLSSHFTTSS